MTFTWWLLPIVALGIGLIVAPIIGKRWADHDEERRHWTEPMGGWVRYPR